VNHGQEGEIADSAARREHAAAQSAARRPARSEWIAAAIGVVLLLGAIGQLLVSALGRDETPPDIVLTVERVTERSESFVVTIRASNHGGAAAAEVEIEGTLRLDDGTETSTFTLDYLPPRSERRGGLLFSAHPGTGELILRARGFASP
jgi:uncharacterized protein (TIGR02588 family)